VNQRNKINKNYCSQLFFRYRSIQLRDLSSNTLSVVLVAQLHCTTNYYCYCYYYYYCYIQLLHLIVKLELSAKVKESFHDVHYGHL